MKKIKLLQNFEFANINEIKSCDVGGIIYNNKSNDIMNKNEINELIEYLYNNNFIKNEKLIIEKNSIITILNDNIYDDITIQINDKLSLLCNGDMFTKIDNYNNDDYYVNAITMK